MRAIIIYLDEPNKTTFVYNSDLAAKPPEDFFQIPNVFHLQLIIKSSADIISVPTYIFSKHYQLETLTLTLQGLRGQDLSLQNLTQTHFENLTALRQLDLAGNNMRRLEATIFTALTKLNCLNLSRNEIEELPESLFANQHQLLILDLSHNLLTYLTTQLFDQTPWLWQLKLGGNHLHDTTNLIENLKPLHYLHMLDLSQNKLQTIWSTESHVNATTTSLKIFRYSNMGMNLTLADGLKYITKLQQENYEGGKLNLTVINLSGNRLRDFTLDWLYN
ncbi:carboxypeptidase N subunit 2-like [Bactrocera dorsalis]|uniref:Carboxypeptidase N subunit 2-like n=1 Tax=Bactrocera dorsalis TaxID=27457 RepID=A0ABM3JBG6_BACDO|nr:carboxypeptidase N subunit 2-like [Bactrocera dorsalis]